jgi:outer membrane protein assembly factor BamE (lipoprotein component of BamABCDE complex)
LETNGFLAPKIDKRVVVNLVFDENAQLSKIKYYDLTDGAEVDFDSNIVLSDGRKLTFWQQMFGNIGNFSSEQFLN